MNVKKIFLTMFLIGIILALNTEIVFSKISNTEFKNDKIQKYVNNLTVTKEQKQSVLQLAEAFQQVFETQTSDRAKVKQVTMKINNALNCIDIQFQNEKKFEQISETVRDLTFDTKEKIKHYINFSNALAGYSLPLPSGNTCEF